MCKGLADPKRLLIINGAPRRRAHGVRDRRGAGPPTGQRVPAPRRAARQGPRQLRKEGQWAYYSLTSEKIVAGDGPAARGHGRAAGHSRHAERNRSHASRRDCLSGLVRSLWHSRTCMLCGRERRTMSGSITTEELARQRRRRCRRRPSFSTCEPPTSSKRWQIEGQGRTRDGQHPVLDRHHRGREGPRVVPKDRDVVVVCAHGDSSDLVVETVGLPNLHNLAGGMDAWARTLVPRTLLSTTATSSSSSSTASPRPACRMPSAPAARRWPSSIRPQMLRRFERVAAGDGLRDHRRLRHPPPRRPPVARSADGCRVRRHLSHRPRRRRGRLTSTTPPGGR